MDKSFAPSISGQTSGPLPILVAAFFVALSSMINLAVSAEIHSSTSENCVLALSGPITPGDLDRLIPIAAASFTGGGESTANNTVCLNSNGGDFEETFKLAKYFYKEGIGTVIEKDQYCLAECALIFMMGKADGAELGFINRRLHKDATLGFSRPEVLISSASSPTTFANSAFETAARILRIASLKSPFSHKEMIHLDLIERLLSHNLQDLFLIDTVDKAGRWDIELFGVSYPDLITNENAFYACHNSTQWESGLNDGDVTYTLAKEWGVAEPERFVGNLQEVVFDVAGINAGYFNHSCLLSYNKIYDDQKMALYLCGSDESTGVEIGSSTCEKKSFSDDAWLMERTYSIFNPATKLFDLP